MLLARLQLAEDSGAALREGSPCSPLGEPAGAWDLPAKAQESPGACALGEAAGAQDLPANTQKSPGACALGEPAGAQDPPAKDQDSPGARAAALAGELELMKGMLFECTPASVAHPLQTPPISVGKGMLVVCMPSLPLACL